MTETIREAFEALQAADDVAALSKLLSAWRERPHARFAELIDQVSRRVAESREPVKATPSLEAAWAARAERSDPADLPALLDALATGFSNQMISRLAILASWPRDPRIQSKLVACLVTPPFPGSAGREVTRAVCALLGESRDPAAYAALRAMVAQEEPYQFVYPRLRKISAAVWKDLVRLVAGLPHLPELPPLSPDELALCHAIEARLGAPHGEARTEEELLAAVYAEPYSDAPRLVYADWLSSRGDPRGEFIALQCERHRSGGPQSRREKQLEKQYARRWAEPLSLKSAKNDLVFRRGFVAECTILRTAPTPPDLQGHPVWSTLEVLRLHNAGMTTIEWANQPQCGALRAIVGASIYELGLLKRKVELLGVRHYSLDDPGVLAALATQTSVRELKLELDREPYLPDFFAFLDKQMPSVERVTFTSGTWQRQDRQWRPLV